MAHFGLNCTEICFQGPIDKMLISGQMVAWLQTDGII